MSHPSSRWLAVAAVIALSFGLPAAAGASAPTPEQSRVPADQASKGMVYRDLVPGSAACAGLFRVRATGAAPMAPTRRPRAWT